MEQQKQQSGNAGNKQTSAVVQAAYEPDSDPFYLIPDTDPEPNVAIAWQRIEREAGRVIPDDAFNTDLPLGRLHARSVVYVLARKPERGKYGGQLRPSRPITSTVDGEKLSTDVPAEELALDMRVYGPIHVSEHWSKGSRFSSRLNRESFLNALAAIATPWAFGWRDVTRKDELPQILYLRSA